MADCCAEVKAELAALKAEIAKFKKIDEESIIKKAVQAVFSNGQWLALVAVVGVIKSDLFKCLTDVKYLKPRVEDARAAAERAFRKSLSIEDDLKVARNELKATKSTAERAFGKAEEVGRGLLNLLSRLAALAGVVTGLAAAVGVLHVLGGRIDVIERYVDSVARDLSRLFGIVTGLQNELRNGIQELRNRLNELFDFAKSILSALTKLQSEVNENFSNINKRFGTVENAINKLRQEVLDLQNGLNQLRQELDNKIYQLRQTIFDSIERLRLEIYTDLSERFKLLIQVINAIQAGIFARLSTHDSELANHSRRLGNLDNAVGNLEGQISRINQQINEILRRLLSLPVASPVTPSTNVINNIVDTINNSNTVTNSVTNNIVNNQSVINNIANSVINNPITTNTIVREIVRQINSTTTVEKVLDNEGLIIVNRRLTILEKNTRENERVNQQAIIKLDQISNQIRTVNSSVSAPNLIRASAEGVCLTTRPGGCLNRLFDPVQQNINSLPNRVRNILGDLFNNFDRVFALINEIMAALEQIDPSAGEPEPTNNEKIEEINKLIKRVYQILGGSLWFDIIHTETFEKIGERERPEFNSRLLHNLDFFGQRFVNNQDSEFRDGYQISSSLPEYITHHIAAIYGSMGLNEFPASVPQSLVTKEGIENQQIKIHNYTKLFEWYIQRFDEIIGQFEIPIEIKDSDPTKPGDQPVGFKLPNIAESIAEIMGLILQISINSEIVLNLATRSLLESGQDKQQNFITYKLLQTLTDYLGYSYKEKRVELPLLFTPEKTKYDELLQETKIKVTVPEFDEKLNFQADLMRFRKAASILDSVYFRKVNPNGDIKAQLMDNLRKLRKDLKDLQDIEDDGFKKFLNEVEEGFIHTPGVTDATHPYGRSYDQRPRIKDLTPDNTTDGSTPPTP